MKSHIDLMGYLVRDRTTGLEGVVVSVEFDIYGDVVAHLSVTGAEETQVYISEVETHLLDKVSEQRYVASPDFPALGAPETEAVKKRPQIELPFNQTETP